MSLPSIVQFMCLDRRSGAVLLRWRAEKGAIYFDSGEIVHAIYGALKGEEAVYQLLSWVDGTFRITSQVRADTHSIRLSWNHILMEGLRKLDERREGEGGGTSSRRAAAAAPAETAEDEEMESDLILLLSRLERMAYDIEANKEPTLPVLAIQTFGEMVNHIVKFAEEVPKGDAGLTSLVQALKKANDVHPQARLLYAQNNRLSVKTAVNLYQSWGDDPADRRYLFRQICLGMVRVLESYMSLFSSYFRSPVARGQWGETSEVFVVDLIRLVDSIEF